MWIFQVAHFVQCGRILLSLNNPNGFEMRIADEGFTFVGWHYRPSFKSGNFTLLFCDVWRATRAPRLFPGKCTKIKTPRAKRAKLLLFIVKYANLWHFYRRGRRDYLSSPIAFPRSFISVSSSGSQMGKFFWKEKKKVFLCTLCRSFTRDFLLTESSFLFFMKQRREMINCEVLWSKLYFSLFFFSHSFIPVEFLCSDAGFRFEKKVICLSCYRECER